jgi:predicted nucleic acid-binding protein
VTNIERLVSRPHVRTPGEGVTFWRLFQESGGATARGNAVSDTHLATLMRENGVRTLYTRDRGFRRFDFLDVRDPFA